MDEIRQAELDMVAAEAELQDIGTGSYENLSAMVLAWHHGQTAEQVEAGVATTDLGYWDEPHHFDVYVSSDCWTFDAMGVYSKPSYANNVEQRSYLSGLARIIEVADATDVSGLTLMGVTEYDFVFLSRNANQAVFISRKRKTANGRPEIRELSHPGLYWFTIDKDGYMFKFDRHTSQVTCINGNRKLCGGRYRPPTDNFQLTRHGSVDRSQTEGLIEYTDFVTGKSYSFKIGNHLAWKTCPSLDGLMVRVDEDKFFYAPIRDWVTGKAQLLMEKPKKYNRPLPIVILNHPLWWFGLVVINYAAWKHDDNVMSYWVMVLAIIWTVLQSLLLIYRHSLWFRRQLFALRERLGRFDEVKKELSSAARTDDEQMVSVTDEQVTPAMFKEYLEDRMRGLSERLAGTGSGLETSAHELTEQERGLRAKLLEYQGMFEGKTHDGRMKGSDFLKEAIAGLETMIEANRAKQTEVSDFRARVAAFVSTRMAGIERPYTEMLVAQEMLELGVGNEDTIHRAEEQMAAAVCELETETRSFERMARELADGIASDAAARLGASNSDIAWKMRLAADKRRVAGSSADVIAEFDEAEAEAESEIAAAATMR